jgi:nicotinamide-nucleotide amidase
MGSRAGVVVTGTEVLTGRVSDRNGPFLAEQLRRLGVDVAEVLIVGDRPDDLRWALGALAAQGLDLIITSGGLGPTADDLTAEIVADVQQRPPRLDPALQERITAILAGLTSRLGGRLDDSAMADGVRKQAMVPDGATVLEPVGTAPGLVVPAPPRTSGPPIVVLPGPPRELQGMWPDVITDPLVLAAVSEREELRQQTVRLWGTYEAELAAMLRGLDGRLDGLEITTCLRGGELEIVTRYGPAAEATYQGLVDALRASFPATVFSTDGRTVEEIVTDALLADGLTVATAESCTAGLLAGRLADRPGSSAYLLGGVVVYSNDAKHELAGVPTELIERVGAVSAEVAEALAVGARTRLGADVGVGITGIAGPGGGTPDKPVGLVHLCVSTAAATLPRRIVMPGSRADVRARSVTVALHLLRELLVG